MKLGYYEVDITPDTSVTMMGFNREDNHSKGVRDCLMAQISVWEEDGNFFCLTSIDNIGFGRPESEQLRNRISKVLDVQKEQIMLVFSHTHAAVNTSEEKEYYKQICEKICSAVQRAKESLEEVWVGWDNSYAEIGVNRRGTAGKVDRRVGILKICKRDSEEIKLILLRLNAHCNVLKRDNYLISADYFGTVRRLFSETYGCPVMVIQGSAGNIAPKYYCSSIVPIDGRGEAYVNSSSALEDMAKEVFGKAKDVLEGIKIGNRKSGRNETKKCSADGESDWNSEDEKVLIFSRFMTLRAEVPDMDHAFRIASEAAEYCGIDGEKWLNAVRNLNEKKIRFQEEQLEVQYFCIGNWCLCGIPNETMTEFALDTEEMLSNPYFFFNGYTNGCSSYFPTEEEYDLGGYEVYWAMLLYYDYYGRVFPYQKEAFSQVKEFAVQKYLL